MYLHLFSRLSVLLLLFTFNTLQAQTTFQRNILDNNEVTKLESLDALPLDDGYLLGGSYFINGKGFVPFLMKLSVNGQPVWYKKYGPAVSETYLTKVLKADDGGFFLTGTTHGFASDWFANAFILKTDAAGELEWAKQINDLSFSNANLSTWGLTMPGGMLLSGFGEGGRSTLTRIDNEGETLWSKRYAKFSFDKPLLYPGLLSGDTIFTSGLIDTVAALAFFNAADGNPLGAFRMIVPGAWPNASLYSMAPASNGDLLLAGYVGRHSPTASAGIVRDQWVCRIGRNGVLRWSKVYPGSGHGRIYPLQNDHYLIIPVQNEYGAEQDANMVKIDGSGAVVWAYRYGIPGPDALLAAFETTNGGIFAAGTVHQPGALYPFILTLKTDANGKVLQCCADPIAPVAVDQPVVIVPYSLNASSHDITRNLSTDAVNGAAHTLDYCPLLYREKDLSFCQGDTVWIGGTAYTSPQTVSYTASGATCDTFFTVHLQYTVLPSVSTLSLDCPANITVELPQGVQAAPVSFDAPGVQSDCPCPDIVSLQTAGPVSGDLLQAGIYPVCFAAQDKCGTNTSCCFQISVQEAPATACDVKTNGCVRFELLRITQDADQRRSYHIRVQNNCNQALQYAAFQLPDGVNAWAPANNSMYESPAGSSFAVRNPNHTPFHSIRFTAQNAALVNGASEVFTYTLPAQSAPLFIHSMVKLANQSYVAAHLNTFNCPVIQESTQRNMELGAAPVLYPNPAGRELFVQLPEEYMAGAEIRLFNAAGQTLQTQEVSGLVHQLLLDYPAGLYWISVQGRSGQPPFISKFIIR